MRRSLFLVGLCLLAADARAAAQQVYVYPERYYGFGGDTALIIPTGKTEYLQLVGSVTGGVAAYSISIFVDTTRLRIVAAESLPGYGLPSPTITRNAADRITLSASGTGYSAGAYLARIAVQAVPGATMGSLFSFRVNSWTTQAGATVDPRTIRTDIENGCIANVLWGDPDSSLTVTGRDALIALTSAVGLPVTGFDLTVADVDEDLQVTSRDALLMLAYAIGENSEYYYTYKAGVPKAGRCAPLAGVPSGMAFLRGSGSLYRVPAGDSVAVAVGSATAFYTSHPVRWLPDGTKILATAYTNTAASYYYEPIAVTVASGVEDTLARNTAYDGGGTYSPDGLRIAFHSTRSSYYLWLMDATGANPAQAQSAVTVTNYSASNPAWSPDGQRVAFTGYQTCCTSGLWTTLVSDGSVRLEFPVSSSYPPLNPSWSPAGDSLLFNANSRVYAVSSPDTATAPPEAVSLSGSLDNASWTSAGILFRRVQGTSTPATYDFYLRRPDGRILRVFRAAGTSDLAAGFR
jgi:hypothetical protein